MQRPNYVPEGKMDDDASNASYRSGGSASYGNRNNSRQQFASPYGTTTASVASDGDLSLKRDREREGRCSECGVQTHEFRLDRMTGRHLKVPLTVDHEVHRGRCLLCHPIPNIAVHAHPSTRSLATVSTLGNQSTLSNYFATHPDYIESASTVTNTSVIEEALQVLEDESCDLLDVLTTMRRFPNEPRIQQQGLEKLWIQSWDDDNSIAIGRVGGIPTILHAMTTFTRVAKLQQYGCEALQNLALNEYNRDFIGEHGGIQAVVQAMNNNQSVVGVQQAGCTALANLAASRDLHMDIANAGGMNAILYAAQSYSDEKHVLRAAYAAFRAMGYDPQRHGTHVQHEQQRAPNQEQQQQQAAPQDNNGPGGGGRNVIRLDAYGFPIQDGSRR